MRARLAKFCSSASISVSKESKREVSAAPRSGDLLGADQPEARILAQPLGIVEVFVTGQATVDRLAEQTGEWKLCVLAAARVPQVLWDEISQAESLVPFADHNQAPVGGDSGTLEIDLPRSVEGELKGLVLFLTHSV
jgi:hypothetical protein